MSKKNIARITKPLSPKPAARRVNTPNPVEEEDLNPQQGRFKKEAAAGASALKTPAPAVRVEFPPAPATVPSKHLAPLAALWKSSIPPRGEANPSQGPALQKAPVTVVAPKASAASAPPSQKPLAQSLLPTSPEKSEVRERAPSLTTPTTVNISFALRKPDAKQVSLCGEFNEWSPSATPMKRNNDGHWETSVALAPGRYQYKFVVDGQWLPDPGAQNNVPNQYGSLNSVLEVRA